MAESETRMTLQENDYKYVLQTFGDIYIGTRYTYEELAAADAAPGKIKDAIYRVFMKDVGLDTTIQEHLLHLDEKSVSYMAYAQMRTMIKITKEVEKTDRKGNVKKVYETKDISLQDFMEHADLHANPDRYLIQEIIIKKRNMMLLHV